jgi:hypothetical protein
MVELIRQMTPQQIDTLNRGWRSAPPPNLGVALQDAQRILSRPDVTAPLADSAAEGMDR